MAIFCAAALGFQANVATALPALYVHYDASDAANVTVDVSDVVHSLTDLSAPLPQLMMPPKQVEPVLCSILIQGT